MARTYRITHGQQYDRAGAYVAWGVLGESIKADGTHDAGDVVRADDADAVHALVLLTIADRQPRTITLGASVMSPERERIKADLDRHQERMERMMDSGDSVYEGGRQT